MKRILASWRETISMRCCISRPLRRMKWSSWFPATDDMTICRRYPSKNLRMKPGLSENPDLAPVPRRSGCSRNMKCILHIVEFGSTQLIKESVEAGLGVTLLSRWAVRKEMQLGTLHMLIPNGKPVARQFSWITQKTPYHTKVVEVFLELLHQQRGFPTYV